MKRSDARDVLDVFQVIQDSRSISVSEAIEKTIRCLDAVGKFDDDKPTQQQLSDLKKINERRSQ